MRILALETVKKIGKEVLLKGWVNTRRDHGKIMFLDLRDRSGIVQLVISTPVKSTTELERDTSGVSPGEVMRVGVEDVIEVVGVVKKRPDEMINPKISTGTVEVEVKSLIIVNHATEMPLPIDSDGYDINEETRLKYRYVDLRRLRLTNNIRLRHKLIQGVRDGFTKRDFVEIETPFFSKATPEGARDFLVPSRLSPGKFYALPQSPQQYKQLLMIAGFERYFQVVRCFRDEDLRADRQFEFTQLDMEVSFPTQEEILQITEDIIIDITEKIAQKKILKKPFPRFTYEEVMKRFGADKFDLREKKDPNVLAFAWITDFPLFEKTETRALAPSHHPFTAPKDEDIRLLDKDPMKVRSWQHDLVCNGNEVAGGSIRITDPKLQAKIFEILGHTQEEIQRKFGHLLEAYKYGAPTHGGIAWGLDRLIALWCGEVSIREVIAFPMTSGGQTSVMDAPSIVEIDQLKELGITVIPQKKK